ncbi:Hypothetical protein A7982_02550 [Minicystis rosea]|nr:Hypothetical protein A7982_02550 [Minicystis rosea]
MEHTIFAIEICARLVPESPLRAGLAQLINDAPYEMSLHQKWTQYSRAAQLLFDNLSLAERGCWDYYNDDARAKRDFDMWSKGMITKEGVRPGPSGSSTPYRGETRFLTLTMALLLVQDSPSCQTLRRVCDVPQANLWKRDTFARVLRGIGHVSFASVKGDVMYLIPRDDGWGLTAQDLQHPKFEYLREIV